MRFTVSIILSIVCVLCVVKQLQCARILAIIPTPSYSHQIPFRVLWLELNKRGHEIVFVSPIPIPNLNLTNFTQIDIGTTYRSRKKTNFIKLRFQQQSWNTYLEDYLIDVFDILTEDVFNNAEMRKLYAPSSGVKFDVVFVELLYASALNAFAHRFDAPLIGVTSLGVTAFNEYVLGGLVMPSHDDTWEMETRVGSNLSFWKRLENYLSLWRHIYLYYYDFVPRQQKLAEKYLGTDIPTVLDIQKNTSVFFVNQANVIASARPRLANMITFSSMHVDKNPKSLPKDLKHFVDSASEGFIYFSLGSNAMSSDMPRETLQVFLDVFAKLPYKVVWKFEKELPEKPDNVFIGPWFPQQSILARPNIKMFIYQGGLQSTEEAVHFTVPLLGLPVLADQDYQVRRMEALGVGKVLEITTIQRDELESAVREIITNKKYKENMIKLRNMMNDNPYDLIKHLVWWTEYVIRYKGTPHLCSNLAHQPWYQYCDMDVVIFLTIVIFTLLSSVLCIIAKISKYLYKQSRTFSRNKKQKFNRDEIMFSSRAIVSSNSSATQCIMKLNVASVLSIVCVLCVVKQLECARILAIVPTPSYSHQIPYRPLWIELNKRGHEVVLVTANPIPDLNLTNFRQINVGESYKAIRQINFMELRFEQKSWIDFTYSHLWDMADTFLEQVFNNTDVKKLCAPNSGTKFDVVLAEVLYMPAIGVFAHRFKAPLIALTSLGIVAINEHMLGGVVLPSHEYTWEMEANAGPNLPFWKRLHNYVSLWHSIYDAYRILVPNQQKLAEKYFGTELPSIIDILKEETSLVFVNQADAIVPARPKLANMITFTSFHVSEKPKPLPQDLKRFVDSASEGFIYFSLGSNAMSSDMPRETLQVFLDVFAKLPYKVVWKFEKELPEKPDNVFIGPWFPQQSILARPNIKMFIYQGGLQSTEEAVHFTVPLLGLPVLADQDYQVRRMEALGVGKVLEITTIQRDELESAIREIITNKKYKENMIRLKETVYDNPYNLVEHLAWWTEYVIRHNGAPHLRSSLAKQPWYRYCDMDIVVFLTIVACIVISIAFTVIIKFIGCLLSWVRPGLPQNQKQKVSKPDSKFSIPVTGLHGGSFAVCIMKFSVATILLVVSFLFAAKQIDCARILAIVPTPSYSHQIPFRPLWIDLNKHGHEIVLITANPIPNLNLTKFTQIDVGSTYPVLKDINFVRLRFEQVSCLKFIEDNIIPISDNIVKHVLNHTDVIKLYAPNSNEHFDLVMVEMLVMPALYAFAHRFNAPLIGVTTLGITAFNEHVFGGVILPSHEASWEMDANTGPNLPFWKRLKNFWNLWHILYLTYHDLVPRQQKIAETYFGPLPPLLDIQKNTSVVFVNQADAMVAARPKLPNLVTFTSFHVADNLKPLPQDLKRFVDNAREGFIYFSLGSNARSSDLPEETLQVFLDVFAKLPYKVVWKFEKNLPGKSKNVFIGSWFSQQTILAHPNIKLFIYQGGLQSSEEAVHFTVPLLGFPVLGDQIYQTDRMETLGVGKRLDLTTVTRDQLTGAIQEIINNKEYKKRMIELKELVNDRPYDLMEHLVWWTEYVIRHKGAPHLRSSLAHQPWYRRYDTDIVIFLTIIGCIIISNLISLITKAIVFIYTRSQSCSANQKQKIN
ncbi:uncharacterized protein LOC143345094 [Colletes latitarsis]|uniref:uncharacterized protein LOC143345094 n=1 Tax=Colletes latitarsis TaxID=2605962 RepID=UPI0040364511